MYICVYLYYNRMCIIWTGRKSPRVPSKEFLQSQRAEFVQLSCAVARAWSARCRVWWLFHGQQKWWIFVESEEGGFNEERICNLLGGVFYIMFFLLRGKSSPIQIASWINLFAWMVKTSVKHYYRGIYGYLVYLVVNKNLSITNSNSSHPHIQPLRAYKGWID